MNRRTFLKVMGSAVAGATCGSLIRPGVSVAQGVFDANEFFGILIDTTRCIGCRLCERACAEVNYLPNPDISEKANQAVFKTKRDTSVIEYTVTNLYETEKGKIFVPWRCMHCNQPACHSACIVYALEKRETGHVTWDQRCIGCRLCMMSCPFQIPKHTFQETAATIQKCNLCYGRFLQGIVPGCVEACPTEALMFGTRRKLLEEGKRRIAQNPGRYINHIYGEFEVGGTSTMYLSAVPFDQIGLRTDLGLKHYPEYSMVYLSAIPFIAGLTPIAMLGIAHVIRMAKKDAKEEHHDHNEEKEKH